MAYQKKVVDIISGEEYINIASASRNTGYCIQAIYNQAYRHKNKRIGYKCCNGIYTVTIDGKENYVLKGAKARQKRIFCFKND